MVKAHKIDTTSDKSSTLNEYCLMAFKRVNAWT